MNIEDLRDYCMSKKAATESFPFDETTLVFKVMNKRAIPKTIQAIQFENKSLDDLLKAKIRNK